MAYPTIFPLFCEPRARACTLYCCACATQVHSHLSFFKLFTDTRSEAGHETCSSSWSCDRNFFLIYFGRIFVWEFDVWGWGMAQRMTFLHRAHPTIFSAHLRWWLGVGEKLSVSRFIFRLNSVPPCGTWTQLYLILVVLLPIFTRFAEILRGQVVRSHKNVWRKNRSGAHGCSPICFNVISFFCRIIRRYLRKKLQRVALAIWFGFTYAWESRGRNCGSGTGSKFLTLPA